MQSEIRNFKKYLMQVAEMDEASFAACIDRLQIIQLKKGDLLVREGEICSKIGYIDKGIFRTFYLKDGNEVNNCFCAENSILASFNSFIKRVPSTLNIQALEDSVLVALPHSSLTELYSYPQWLSVGRLLTERECIRLTEMASSMSFETAKEKYLNMLKSQPDVVKRVSIQHIASYIGVSRETLSRIRSKIGE